MYETHFGFSGTPFNLNPDPAFYFQSKGHGHVLSYLRFGVYQGEGFVVVTGEIGAGKTTLVRTLLSELDGQKIVSAQIVSTQLEAGDLLRSVAIAFGIAPHNLSKAELIGSIEAFLTVLVTQGRRALLIIDEAQNLNLKAIEEMRMLSNFQFGNHALLQTFLVGQPELRQLLTSKPMEQFRQRVIASCHLGPMDASETKAYIEHRLAKVGWQGVPSFGERAFERIYYWTGGTPRRVNLLCNRLLLSTYLDSGVEIDPSRIDTVAAEVLDEVGESKAHLTSVVDVPGAASRAGDGPGVPTRHPARGGAIDEGPILALATNQDDDVRLAVLLQSLRSGTDSPELSLVRIGEPTEFAANEAFHRSLGLDVPIVELRLSESAPALRLAETIREFDAVLGLHQPRCLLVVGESDEVLGAALAARKHGCAVIDASRPAAATTRLPKGPEESLVQRLCSTVEGEPGSSWPESGLWGAVVAAAVDAGAESASILPAIGAPAMSDANGDGYALVDADSLVLSADRRGVVALLAELREASALIQLVWPVGPAAGAKLDAFGLAKSLPRDRFVVARSLDFADRIALAVSARCLLADSTAKAIEWTALGLPSLVLGASESAVAGYSPEALKVLLQSRPEMRLQREAQRGGAKEMANALLSYINRADQGATSGHASKLGG